MGTISYSAFNGPLTHNYNNSEKKKENKMQPKLNTSIQGSGFASTL